MNGIDFLDTNVLVYAYQNTDPRKQRVARDFVRKAIAGKSVISAQVLSEFTATLLHKFSQRYEANQLLDILGGLSPMKVVAADADMVRRAVEAHEAYGIHFYDGLIVAAAERGGCTRIWSEDLNEGQEYFGITVTNPFR
jgi:predicted nucleic acid-binding protein